MSRRGVDVTRALANAAAVPARARGLDDAALYAIASELATSLAEPIRIGGIVYRVRAVDSNDAGAVVDALARDGEPIAENLADGPTPPATLDAFARELPAVLERAIKLSGTAVDADTVADVNSRAERIRQGAATPRWAASVGDSIASLLKTTGNKAAIDARGRTYRVVTDAAGVAHLAVVDSRQSISVFAVSPVDLVDAGTARVRPAGDAAAIALEDALPTLGDAIDAAADRATRNAEERETRAQDVIAAAIALVVDAAGLLPLGTVVLLRGGGSAQVEAGPAVRISADRLRSDLLIDSLTARDADVRRAAAPLIDDVVGAVTAEAGALIAAGRATPPEAASQSISASRRLLVTVGEGDAASVARALGSFNDEIYVPAVAVRSLPRRRAVLRRTFGDARVVREDGYGLPRETNRPSDVSAVLNATVEGQRRIIKAAQSVGVDI